MTGGPAPLALSRILKLSSIAIIGASARANSVSRTVLDNLTGNGYAGAVHLVGREAGELASRPVLGSVADEPCLAGMRALAHGGVAINIGVVAGDVPINVHAMMDQQLRLIGSNWFTAGEGRDMARLAEAGILDLSRLKHRTYPLEQVNEAISRATVPTDGGFSNAIVSAIAAA